MGHHLEASLLILTSIFRFVSMSILAIELYQIVVFFIVLIFEPLR
jgi:hypothetical protein